MAALPFKAVSWSPNEPITDEKLDAMVNNDNWLLDNSVRGLYTGHGVKRTEGVKIAAGLALITAGKAPRGSKQVDFDGFFLSVARPIVTTGVVSGEQRQVWVSLDGLGTLHPDNRGFQVHAVVHAENKKDRRIKRNLYISWMALGY